MSASWKDPERDAELRREELLGERLEALFDEPLRRAAARARLAASADDALALRRLETRLAEARAELEDVPGWSPAREEHLIERVRAATTRAAHPSSFPSSIPASLPATERRSASRWWWASAAAALVACLGALAYRERAPGVNEELARVDAAPARATRLAPLASKITPSTPISAPARASLQPVELALARRELTTSVAAARPPHESELDPGADAPLELRLLDARAKGLREHRWDTWLKEVPLADLGPLSLALWCEVQLDRFVLSGERPPAWTKAVAILERGLASQPQEDEGSKLLAHALERAREYGLIGEEHGLTGGVGAGVEVARLEPAGGELWTREWFEDLEAAGHEAGLSETGTWRAWVGWRGQ